MSSQIWPWGNVTIRGAVRDDVEKTPEMYEKETAPKEEFVPGIYRHCYICSIATERLPVGQFVTLIYEKERTDQELREYKQAQKYAMTLCNYCYSMNIKR
jgi:hypothetical protein